MRKLKLKIRKINILDIQSSMTIKGGDYPITGPEYDCATDGARSCEDKSCKIKCLPGGDAKIEL